MATLISLSIDTKKIKKSLLHKEQYLNLTVAINDEANEYNQNVSAWVSQTKEEREDQEDRKYIGNGATIWTDGECMEPIKKEKEKPKAKAKAKPKAKSKKASDDDDDEDDDMPF